MAINDILNESIFHNDSIYEEYVLGRLTKLEENHFEEHLLTCEHCQAQLEYTETIIYGSKTTLNKRESKGFTFTKATKSLIVKYSIAAGIALILGVSSYFYLQSGHYQKTIISETRKALDDSISNGKKKGINPILVQPQDEKANPNEDLIAMVYRPNAVFENAIENVVRANSLIIIKPVLAAEINIKERLTFEWEWKIPSLQLAIFNNKGVIIFQKEVNSPFVLDKYLKEGLYYWQLESSDESLFTGKFLIKKH